MASSPRARAAVIASGLLIATPTSALAQDTPAPPPAEPAAKAPEKAEKAPPPPPPARPMSAQPPQPLLRPPPPPAPVPEARPRGKRGPAYAPRRPRKGDKALEGLPVVSAPSFFRLDDGSTRISVECGAKVDIGEAHAQGRLVYRLKNARVLERTNQLPLMTGFFATPVERAQLVQLGADVDLIVELREGTTPAFKAVETPRGIVLQIDFPKTVHAAERAANLPDNGSREHAKRRQQSTTLGVDRGADDGNQNTGN